MSQLNFNQFPSNPNIDAAKMIWTALPSRPYKDSVPSSHNDLSVNRATYLLRIDRREQF